MNVVALLSAGRHPVSGNPVLPRLEAQMIRLATGLGTVVGLHAGASSAPAVDALGHGLKVLQYIPIDEKDDPVPSLAAALLVAKPTLILAGRRGQGRDETGLVPYLLARALAMPILADAIAIAWGSDPGKIVVDQALAKGAIRRVTMRLPAIVTVHPSAPVPLPYAYGQARRGQIETIELSPLALDRPAILSVEERPYRPRPKMMQSVPSGASAAERLKAATGEANAGKANVLVDPAPEVAAREILAYLRRVGVLRRPAPDAA